MSLTSLKSWRAKSKDPLCLLVPDDGTDSEVTPLLIFPYNGNGLEALDCLADGYKLTGFVDDKVEKQGISPYGFAVYSRAAIADFPESRILAIPGSPESFRTRAQAISSLGVDESRFARVVHPSARISPLASIGYNVLIMAGVVITSNCVIGNHVCILPNTVVHHDSKIGDWSLVGSNVTIAGAVTIGENCYIGSGSTVLSRLEIGNRAMVGLGSNVLRSVAEGTTVAGNPARTIRRWV